VRVVAVAVEELGAVAHDRAAFVGQAPAGGGVDVEHRDAHQFAHRRDAHHAHFALVAAAPEAVVVVQFAWRDVDVLPRFLDRCGPGLAAHHCATEGGGRNGCAGNRAGAEEATTAHAALLQHLGIVLALVTHGVSLLWDICFKHIDRVLRLRR